MNENNWEFDTTPSYLHTFVYEPTEDRYFADVRRFGKGPGQVVSSQFNFNSFDYYVRLTTIIVYTFY